MVFPLVLLLLITLAVGTYYVANSPLSNDTSTLLSVCIAAGLLLTCVQTLSVFGSMNVDWPAAFDAVLAFVRVFAFDVTQLRLACVAGNPPSTAKYMMLEMVPFAVVVLYFFLFLLGKVCERLEMEYDKMINTIGQLLQALYIVVAMNTLIPFQCYRHPNRSSSVREWAYELCDLESAEYESLLGMAVLFTLFYPVALLGGTVFLTRRAVHSVQDRRVLVRYRFLLFRFRPELPNWSGVYLLRNLLICIIPVMSPDDSTVQTVLMTTLLMTFLVLQVHFWPWRTRMLNVLDTVMLAALLLVISAGQAFVPMPEDKTFSTVMIMAAFAMVGLLLAGYVSHGLTVVLLTKGGCQASSIDVERTRRLRRKETLSKRWRTYVFAMDSVDEENHEDFVANLMEHDLDCLEKFMEILGAELLEQCQIHTDTFAQPGEPPKRRVRFDLPRALTNSTKPKEDPGASGASAPALPSASAAPTGTPSDVQAAEADRDLLARERQEHRAAMDRLREESEARLGKEREVAAAAREALAAAELRIMKLEVFANAEPIEENKGNALGLTQPEQIADSEAVGNNQFIDVARPSEAKADWCQCRI